MVATAVPGSRWRPSPSEGPSRVLKGRHGPQDRHQQPLAVLTARGGCRESFMAVPDDPAR